MKKLLLKLIPWVITIIALRYAFAGVPFGNILTGLASANPLWIVLAVTLTFLSYFLRAYRWQYFFTKNTLRFSDLYKVLNIGFFMNNILPARAGELIRAHLGAKLAQKKRTTVLASVACERLADGVVLSLFFIIYAVFFATDTNSVLLLVAAVFVIALLAVFTLLFFQNLAFRIIDRLAGLYPTKVGDYALSRLKLFISGLNPLLDPHKSVAIISLSLLVWSVELLVFFSVSQAFGSVLGVFSCVLFMVAVNFSSLVPAAPGGIGVIEAFAKSALVSIGVQEDLALTMVITQHFIQFAVIAIPGAIFSLSYLKQIKAIKREIASDTSASA